MISEKERLYLIIDASGFTYIDYTGIERLKDLSQELKTRNVEIFVAASKGNPLCLFSIFKIEIYQFVYIYALCSEPVEGGEKANIFIGK